MGLGFLFSVYSRVAQIRMTLNNGKDRYGRRDKRNTKADTRWFCA